MADLKKLFDRLNKIEEKKQAVKEGKPVSVRSGISEAERIKRAQEKARKDYIKSVMSDLKEILGSTTDMQRISDMSGIREQAIMDGRDYINEDNLTVELALLDIQKFALVVKSLTADQDIDLVIDAEENLEVFNEAVRVYAAQVIDAGDEVDEDKIADMYDKYVSNVSDAVLQRGTTVYKSIDMHVSQVSGLVKKGECEDWKAELCERLTRLYNRYNINPEFLSNL